MGRHTETQSVHSHHGDSKKLKSAIDYVNHHSNVLKFHTKQNAENALWSEGKDYLNFTWEITDVLPTRIDC